MNLTEDVGVFGLREALDRLPISSRRPALRALGRLITDDRFGVREAPKPVVVRSKRTGQRYYATLYILHGGGFSFDVFLLGTALVVARIYEFLPAYLAPAFTS